MARASTADRNRAAIARYEASGARPVFLTEQHAILVSSASDPGRIYTVRVLGLGKHPVVHCSCIAGRRATDTGFAAGSTPCWHGAAALDLLEQYELVAFNGDHWHLTIRGHSAPGLTKEHA